MKPPLEQNNGAAEKLSLLFSLSRQPVLGIKDDMIIFANPAAETELQAGICGKPAAEVVPDIILGQTADSFVSTAEFAGREASVTVTRFDGITVLSLTFTAEQTSMLTGQITKAFTARMATAAQTLKMAADKIMKFVEESGDTELKRNVSMLMHSYYEMHRLNNNLDMSNAIASGKQVFNAKLEDLGEICIDLRDSIKVLIVKKGVNLAVEIPQNEKLLASVDRKLFEQMLLNLITNSLQHTSQGGDICLKLKRSGGSAVISIHDTGKGISQKVLLELFTPLNRSESFEQLANGAGIGLLVAKGIAELHGGRLVVENLINTKGASIHISLPLISEDDKSGRVVFGDTVPADGYSAILREMAPVLGHESYDSKYMSD